jgi:hypothetical protein
LPPESPFVPIAPHSEHRSSEASRARGIRDPVWEKVRSHQQRLAETERERGKSASQTILDISRIFRIVACRDVRRFVLLALVSTRSHSESWHESRFATGRSPQLVTKV